MRPDRIEGRLKKIIPRPHSLTFFPSSLSAPRATPAKRALHPRCGPSTPPAAFGLVLGRRALGVCPAHPAGWAGGSQVSQKKKERKWARRLPRLRLSAHAPTPSVTHLLGRAAHRSANLRWIDVAESACGWVRAGEGILQRRRRPLTFTTGNELRPAPTPAALHGLARSCDSHARGEYCSGCIPRRCDSQTKPRNPSSFIPIKTQRSHLSPGTTPTVRPPGGAPTTRPARVTSTAASSTATPFVTASIHTPYDYIIVGGGTAGCVLAARLSENGTKRVLVVEAGPSGEFRNVRTPAGLPRLFKSHLDWNLYAPPQAGADGRRVYLARGKLLGGCSATNATLYHRGAPGDYAAWAVPGWGPSDVAPWFVAGEANELGDVPGVHGGSGPLSVEFPRYRNKLHDAFFAASASLGWPARADFNDWGTTQAGYGEFQVMQRKGARCDAAAAYLTPAVRARPNLTLVAGASVLGVEIEAGAARGIRYVRGDPDQAVLSASLAPGGEVLMCAGAVHTPHLLMLSGVGDGRALAAHGIGVKADLPGVGANLQDHPAALVAYTLKPSAGAISVTDQIMHADGRVRARAVLNYALRRRGPLTTTGCDHGAFVSTGARTATLGDAPDLQIRLAPALALDADGIGSYVEFARLKESGRKWPSGVTFQLLAVRPASRGAISLRSADPFDTPVLDPGFLSDAAGADAATLRAGVRIARDLAATPAFEGMVEAEVHPGPGAATDAALDAYLAATLHSGNAVVGSARMGPDPRAGAVVDADLRVHGVAGLRVVDASVFPTILGGQTGAPVLMLAERAAAGLVRGGGRVAGVAAAVRAPAPALA